MRARSILRLSSPRLGSSHCRGCAAGRAGSLLQRRREFPGQQSLGAQSRDPRHPRIVRDARSVRSCRCYCRRPAWSGRKPLRRQRDPRRTRIQGFLNAEPARHRPRRRPVGETNRGREMRARSILRLSSPRLGSSHCRGCAAGRAGSLLQRRREFHRAAICLSVIPRSAPSADRAGRAIRASARSSGCRRPAWSGRKTLRRQRDPRRTRIQGFLNAEPARHRPRRRPVGETSRGREMRACSIRRLSSPRLGSSRCRGCAAGRAGSLLQSRRGFPGQQSV